MEDTKSPIRDTLINYLNFYVAQHTGNNYHKNDLQEFESFFSFLYPSIHPIILYVKLLEVENVSLVPI